MATNKGQFLGAIYTNQCQLEVREVELASESWKKLDELAQKCLSTNHRDPSGYIIWLLEHYIYLCERVEGFSQGILPEDADLNERNNTDSGVITVALKKGQQAADPSIKTPVYVSKVKIPKGNDLSLEEAKRIMREHGL